MLESMAAPGTNCHSERKCYSGEKDRNSKELVLSSCPFFLSHPYWQSLTGNQLAKQKRGWHFTPANIRIEF